MNFDIVENNLDFEEKIFFKLEKVGQSIWLSACDKDGEILQYGNILRLDPIKKQISISVGILKGLFKTVSVPNDLKLEE